MKTLTTFMLLVAALLGYSMDASAQTRSVRVPVDLTGSEILRRFHVYFDYQRERMILEPNGHLNDPFPTQ